MQARLKGDEMFLFTPRRCRTWRMGLCSMGRVVASSMAGGWCPALPAEKTCKLESFWGALGKAFCGAQGHTLPSSSGKERGKVSFEGYISVLRNSIQFQSSSFSPAYKGGCHFWGTWPWQQPTVLLLFPG